MTIKRRLFISNILMIVLPILLVIVTGVIAVLLFWNITGTLPSSFREGAVIYGDEAAAAAFVLESGDAQRVGEVTIYRSETQGFFAAIPDTVEAPFSRTPNSILWPMLFIALMGSVVYLTNRTLTRRIFRTIMSPIDTLVRGVHEIRDGNLAYRIDYAGKDEFAAVCSDFNEMADHLLEMVEQRQKDEQSRRELIAGISHDLRTPLTSVKSYVKALRDGIAKSPEKEREYLDVVYRKTCDLQALIDQLFLFSKLETDSFPFRFRPVLIDAYMSALLDALRRDTRNRAVITLDSRCAGYTAMLDGEQMGRAITNIVDNSVKYNLDRTVHIDIALYPEDGQILLRLRDDGRGVPDKQLPRLFDFFYRGDEARSDPSGGSGLGLAIARKIVAAHGGRISAENAGGLAIVIALPAQERGAAS